MTVSAVALLGLAPLPAFAQGNPLRDAYFGETHVHTSYSADAWLFGDRMTDPGDAYKYFKGETRRRWATTSRSTRRSISPASPTTPNMSASSNWRTTRVRRSASCLPRNR
jgi:hypothetical protein